MKSFGIWYSSPDIQEHHPVEHSSPVSAEKEPELDLHINLWDISGKRAKSAVPFIDIGMNISEYLKLNFELGDILAYHWKNVSESEQLKEYAQMVKVTSAATSWFIIIVYMLVVVALGILTNSLFAAFVQPLLGL